MQAEAQNF